MAMSTASKYCIIAMNPNSTSSMLNLTFHDTDFAEIDAVRTQNGGAEWILPLSAISLTIYIFDRSAC
ncbi:hypothetical protein IW261DRAFT_1525232 [Armillaria novae-zelandiae]|uniref:Uncharacterized protein n=1 Tax=Armillaria novae-zelandiae TaxID=153914 RepID=A0AA39ND05_9AGAR|nr:hypothetical protein IW261DRAFT_1525232 [Armillaria novae-zelandiae]